MPCKGKKKRPKPRPGYRYHPPVGEHGVGAWYDETDAVVDGSVDVKWRAYQETYTPRPPDKAKPKH